MKAPLAIRFDKEEIEEACQKIANGLDLTKANVARAAMDIGLEKLEEEKKSLRPKEFEAYVMHYGA